jgi:hypothetical protein
MSKRCLYITEDAVPAGLQGGIVPKSLQKCNYVSGFYLVETKVLCVCTKREKETKRSPKIRIIDPSKNLKQSIDLIISGLLHFIHDEGKLTFQTACPLIGTV